MKIKIVVLLVCLCSMQIKSEAQVVEIISVIKGAITKVIKAVDLEVQRMQTKTIWLQNAQKELENTMSELKLGEITDWVQKQKDLYDKYYTELSDVKQIIADYEKVKKITQLQQKIFSMYKSSFNLLRQDKNFSPEEIDCMYKIFSGLVSESVRDADGVLAVVSAFVTQMDDAARIKIIDGVENDMQQIYDDLRRFTSEQIELSVHRALEKNDAESVKKLYGLP